MKYEEQLNTTFKVLTSCRTGKGNCHNTGKPLRKPSYIWSCILRNVQKGLTWSLLDIQGCTSTVSKVKN